ncbi:hypothetical protein OC846_005901 [Tilletia horrida]|uniref:Uncharacterized protein n=1 Tax=Tilletia horrida TaxID=155126 RepID=A0AAN6JPG9_9BASI|nr:hypothetical protein OC846_005901 [Tilletia horrida]
MAHVVYQTAAQSWQSAYVIIKDELGKVLVELPRQFVEQAGCNRASYALEMIESCFDHTDGNLVVSGKGLRPRALEDDDPLPWDLRIVYHHEDGERHRTNAKVGPRFDNPAWVAHVEKATPWTSNRSIDLTETDEQEDQRDFRDHVLARDSTCLISDAGLDHCIAGHILPVTRPEQYREILRFFPDSSHPIEARVSTGLLLRHDLYRSYRAGEWALYPQDNGDLIAHFFVLNLPDAPQLHGKVITPARFHLETRFHPKRELLWFHYVQCAMMRFRGNPMLGPKPPQSARILKQEQVRQDKGVPSPRRGTRITSGRQS